METGIISQSEYVQFIESHPLVSIWQTAMMADMQVQKGNRVLFLGTKDGGRLIAATSVVLEPAHFGRLHARSPRGPVLDYSGDQVSEIISSIRDFLRTQDVLYWSLDPYAIYQKHSLDGEPVPGTCNQSMMYQLAQAGAIHQGFSRGIDNSTEPRWIYVIDTSGRSEKELLSSFEHKCSRSIRRGLEFGVKVRELSRDELHILDDMFACAGQKHEFAWRADDYNLRLWNAFHDSGAVKFLAAEISLEDFEKKLQENLAHELAEKAKTEEKLAQANTKKMSGRLREIEQRITALHKRMDEAREFAADGPVLTLAAGIFFDYGKEVICLMSGYDDRYAWFCGPYMMHWHMIRHCIEKGYERYNLYGISGHFGEDAIDSGVYAFKKGFAGEVWELPGDFRIPVDRGRYRLYTLAKKLR